MNVSTIQYVIAIFLTLVGSFLLISGFWVAPEGIIDNSVLVAFGEIMTFVGTLLGIDYVWGQRYRNLKDTITKEKNESK